MDRNSITSKESQIGQRVTLVGAVVNVFLVLFKLLLGILGNSQALVADAVHSISDLVSDGVVLWGIRQGRKQPDADHHFGHARIETLASGLVGVLLVVAAVVIGYEAAIRIYLHEERHPAWFAVVGAFLALGVKEWLYHYTIRVGRRIRSQAIVANAWHHRSDALSSAAVLLGVLGAVLYPDWHILDGYAAMVVSVFILIAGFQIIWGSAKEMIDTAPTSDVLEKMKACVQRVAGVENVHDLKVRSLGGLYHIQVHVVVDGDMKVAQGHTIAKTVEKCLLEEIPGVGNVIIHIDPAPEK